MKTYCVRLWILGMVMCVFASCSDDTPTADPYADWEARNVAYIDSIADVVANPPAGETWYRYANYKIQNDGMGTDLTLTNSDYVYVKDLTEADAELGETPFATDTVLSRMVDKRRSVRPKLFRRLECGCTCAGFVCGKRGDNRLDYCLASYAGRRALGGLYPVSDGIWNIGKWYYSWVFHIDIRPSSGGSDSS